MKHKYGIQLVIDKYESQSFSLKIDSVFIIYLYE